MKASLINISAICSISEKKAFYHENIAYPCANISVEKKGFVLVNSG